MAPIIHTLLIAALLACPYRCLAGQVVLCAAPQQPQGCACCKHRQANSPATSGGMSDRQKPGRSAPSEDCRCDCLCQGAVRTDDDVASESVCFAPFVVAEQMPQSGLVLGRSMNVAWDEGPPPGVSLAGRSLRLALESLQI